MERSNTDLQIISSLERAAKQLNCAKEKFTKDYNLTTSEFGVLEALYHKHQLPMQSLCKILLLKSGSLTYVTEKLISKNLIERNQKGDDKRFFYISLTEEGQQLIDEIYPTYLSFINMLFANESDDSISVIITFLQNLIHNINCFECSF